MLSQQLVGMIEKNAETLTRSFIADVRKHEGTPSYHNYDEQKLYERTFAVYSELGRWISRDTTKQAVAEHYKNLGRQLRQEGFAVSEVIQALILMKRRVWLKVLQQGMLDTVIDLTKALELNNRVVLFFDRAIFFAAQGFEQK